MEDSEFLAAEEGVQGLIDEYNDCNEQDDEEYDVEEEVDEEECADGDETTQDSC